MFNIIFSFIFVATAMEAPSGWIYLNAKNNALCSKEKPCSLKKGKEPGSFQVTAEFFEKDGKLKLSQLDILEKEKKTASSFSQFDEFQLLFKGEQLHIFSLDLNGDQLNDLALFSSVSPKQGELFYYFIYNPQTQSFVLSGKSMEALNPTPKGLVGRATHKQYKVDKDLLIKVL